MFLNTGVGFLRNSRTEYAMSLLVTKRVIVKNSIEFVMKWRELVYRMIIDSNIKVIYTKKGYLD